MGSISAPLTRVNDRQPATFTRNALEAELAGWNWGDAVTIKVTEGVITLEGKVLDEREKTALRVAAENVTGVKRVDDKVEVVLPLHMPVPPPGFYL